MSDKDSNRPIAIFDSGLGGLTVTAAIRNKFPNEDLIFLADRARVPYASLSTSLIEKYAFECFDYLLRFDPKILVVACNTVSAVCIDEARARTNIPVMDVIAPTARAAARATTTRRIGVLATHATVKRRAYDIALSELLDDVQVFSQGCPLLVPLVEDGWTEGEIPRKIMEHYLQPVVHEQIDTLILGCTHYEYFRNMILDVAQGIKIVNTPEETASELMAVLNRFELAALPDHSGAIQIFSTDINDALGTVVRSLFGNETVADRVQIRQAILSQAPALT